jgi:hypothetical protein
VQLKAGFFTGPKTRHEFAAVRDQSTRAGIQLFVIFFEKQRL